MQAALAAFFPAANTVLALLCTAIEKSNSALVGSSLPPFAAFFFPLSLPSDLSIPRFL